MKKIRLVHEVRAVKKSYELKNIIKAQNLSESVLRHILGHLHTGISETDVSDGIKKMFIKLGAPVLSFHPIVAFGKNTANIHHSPGSSRLKIGDIIMLDFGCTVKNYCSDMTRTFFWGKPKAKQKRIYLSVLQAMNLALIRIKAGERRANKVDRAAREFLNKKYGEKKFPHGLGHGVGTVIHEWPNFKPKSEDILPINCVMTVEPGVYFKGWGGIRIEDMVMVTKRGYTNLTHASKDLKDATLKVK